MFASISHTHTIRTFLFGIIILFLCSTDSFSQSSTAENQGTVLFSDFLSNKNDTVLIENKMHLFEFLKILNCLSGHIYFSGDGFSSATVLKCNGNLTSLKIIFEKCLSGSKIVLEDCSIFRDGGQKPIVLNKIIVFK